MPLPGDAAAGAVPGAVPGTAPVGGEGGPGGQGNQQQLGPKGSPEYAIQRVMQMAKSGDYSGADEVISKKAKGLAAGMRNGDLTSSQLDSFKTSFDNLQYLSRKASGGSGMAVNYAQGNSTVYTFTVIKEEGGTFRVSDIKETKRK
jgi:hypothetical protein